jgi:hypothetical protein
MPDWTTNSITVYLIIKLTLSNGLLGYFNKEKDFVTNKMDATKFQNQRMLSPYLKALHENNIKTELEQLWVNE